MHNSGEEMYVGVKQGHIIIIRPKNILSVSEALHLAVKLVHLTESLDGGKTVFDELYEQMRDMI